MNDWGLEMETTARATTLPWVLAGSRVPGWVQFVSEARTAGSRGLVSSSVRSWRWGVCSLLIGASARMGRRMERAVRVKSGLFVGLLNGMVGSDPEFASD